MASSTRNKSSNYIDIDKYTRAFSVDLPSLVELLDSQTDENGMSALKHVPQEYHITAAYALSGDISEVSFCWLFLPFQGTSFLIVFLGFFVFYTIISYVSSVIKFASSRRVFIRLE